jgi:CHAT domain-containing protein
MLKIIFLNSNIIIWLWLLSVPGYCSLKNIPEKSIQALIENALEYSEKGDFQQSAIIWKTILSKLDIEKNVDQTLNAVIHIANAYKNLGYHQKAVITFQKYQSVAEKNAQSTQTVLFYNAASDLFASLGNIKESIRYLQKAAKNARMINDPYLIIKILLNMSITYKNYHFFGEAQEGLEQCLKLLEQIQTKDINNLKPRILVELVSVKFRWDEYSQDEVINALERAHKEINRMSDTHDKAGLLIFICTLAKEMVKTFPSSNQYLIQIIYKGLTDADKIAQKLSNKRMISLCAGHLASIYEILNKYDHALKLTRKAVLYAENNNPDILYYWEWQLGRLFKATGQIDLAVELYYKAISTLNPIRNEITVGHRNNIDIFNLKIKPVYLGLAELLLEQAESIQSDDHTMQKKYQEVIDVMDLLKRAELQDFFEDECLAHTSSSASIISYSVHQKTAIIYPIPLPNKLALLIILPDGIKLVNVNVESSQLTKSVLLYREHLQIRAENLFMKSGPKLYRLLIYPMKELLDEQNVDTLIIAPDGALRLIPFSTLYDGEKFLIESYAISTIPSFAMTDMKPAKLKNADILLGGLSEPRMGHIPLPNVIVELQDINKIMNANTLLKNKDFTIENLTYAFNNKAYGIVHLATHGVFGGSSETSYILTYNNMLKMAYLETLIKMGRFRKQKVELLTFSACQTAMGNDRAALGLAGVAVKAGVRSVIATLWYVDDEASAAVLKEFYHKIHESSHITKSKALQKAQITLVNDIYYWHPNYWGPFMLIGNWL